MKFHHLLLAAATLFLTSCLSKRELTISLPATLPASTPIRVQVPSNGVYGETVYANSGEQVAQRLVGALIPYFPRTSLGEYSEAGEVLLRPQILHWEDRATEWSGKRDRVEISLPVYRSNGQLIGTALITAKSSYWTMGGDHPEDLLARPLKVYAAGLAGKPYRDRLVIQR